jgi:GntR family transcriptional regulator
MTETSSSARRGVAALTAALRTAITRGDYRPGDQLPTNAQLVEQYGVNKNTVSRAIADLKSAGLLTGPPGGRTKVRVQPPHITRSNIRYHREKAEVHLSKEERAGYGTAEADSGLSVHALFEDQYGYEKVTGPDDVREILGVTGKEQLLRRTYLRRHAAQAGASYSTSHLSYALASQNPDLLNASNEPWPGGTQHQLYTVGVEIDYIDDHIVASMPSREEQLLLDIPTGVPLICIRKISYATTGEAVEVSDIPLPADRAELMYRTRLERWQ